MEAETKRVLWGLMRRRDRLVPTWRGWILCVCGLALFVCVIVRQIYPFLDVDDSRPGGVLVVDGGAPEYCLRAAVAEFHQHHYTKLVVAGGPVDKGGRLIELKTFPEVTAAVLFRLGMTSNEVALALGPGGRQDRMLTAAVGFKWWWRGHEIPGTPINLMCIGAHARRARLLFEKVLGDGTEVGVIARWPREYDPYHWWRSSEGFRTVTTEAIAYFYVRLLFRSTEGEINL